MRHVLYGYIVTMENLGEVEKWSVIFSNPSYSNSYNNKEIRSKTYKYHI